MKWEEYLVPASLEEALAVLEERQGQARVIAGGTDLIIQLKNKEVTARCLVDVTNLEELKGIELEDGFIRIGACVTHHEVACSSLIRERAAALAEGASQVGSPQIRNMGTVGGNIVNAQPAADTAIPLLALEAEVEVATATGTRREPLGGIYMGPGQCTVDPTAEILTAVRFRALGPNQGSAFERLAKRKALSLPILNAAAVVTLSDGIRESGNQGSGNLVSRPPDHSFPHYSFPDHFKEVRLAVGPVAPTPFRPRQAEEALRGAAIEAQVIAAALELAVQEAQPRTNPVRASQEYRREMVKVLLRRSIERAVQECRGARVQGSRGAGEQGSRGAPGRVEKSIPPPLSPPLGGMKGGGGKRGG
jgi:carbon-monoxide dehydrogenase medium subunit